jgi:hypothetical protein
MSEAVDIAQFTDGDHGSDQLETGTGSEQLILTRNWSLQQCKHDSK